MDRFSWAIALAALLLFAGIVVASFVMTSVFEAPGVSCTGSATCRTVPRPTFDDTPVPSTRPAPPDSSRY